VEALVVGDTYLDLVAQRPSGQWTKWVKVLVVGMVVGFSPWRWVEMEKG
jgi:hypothetical protein